MEVVDAPAAQPLETGPEPQAPHNPAQERGPADQASPKEAPSTSKSHLVLTLGRVKTLIKEDADVKFVSAEAYYAIAKATEMLLELVTERAGSGMLRGGRSELTYDDVAAVVAEWKALDFLQDIVPSRMPVALALQRMLQTRAQAAPGGT